MTMMRSIVMGQRDEISVHGIIIRSGRILLLRRSDQNKRGQGDYEFPGGKVDYSAEDFESELRREVLEETGYELHLGKPLGFQVANIIIRRKRKPAPQMSLFWPARIKSGTLTMSVEHDDCKWCSFSEAKQLPLSTRTRNALTKFRSVLKDQFKMQM